MAAYEQPFPRDGDAAAKLVLPSYASILGTRSKTSIIRGPTDHRIGSKDGYPAIYFSRKDVDRAKEFMKGGLIFKFSIGQRPALSDIRAMISRDWNIFGEFTLGIIDHRHVLMKVEAETEVIKVLAREKTHVKGVFFQVSRWSLDFDPKRDLSTASIWIELPGLRLHHYHPDFLAGAAEVIGGKFLKSDEETLCHTRAMGARFCMEIDLLKEFPEFIFVSEAAGEGYWQRVKYPKIFPAYCVYCKRKGHHIDICRVKTDVMAKLRSGEKNNENNHEKMKEVHNKMDSGKAFTSGVGDAPIVPRYINSNSSNDRRLVEEGKAAFVQVQKRTSEGGNEKGLKGDEEKNSVDVDELKGTANEVNTMNRQMCSPKVQSVDGLEKQFSEPELPNEDLKFAKSVREELFLLPKDKLNIVFSVFGQFAKENFKDGNVLASSSSSDQNMELSSSAHIGSVMGGSDNPCKSHNNEDTNIEMEKGDSHTAEHTLPCHEDTQPPNVEKVSCTAGMNITAEDVINPPFELVVDIGNLEKIAMESPLEVEDDEKEVISDFEEEPPPVTAIKAKPKKNIFPLSVKTRSKVTSTSPRYKSR